MHIGMGNMMWKDVSICEQRRKVCIMSIDSDTPGISPQQYEVLHGGGAEAAEIARQRLSRRSFLRRSMLAVWGTSAAAAVAGDLYYLYPNVATGFGGKVTVGKAADFKAAKPSDFKL